MKLKNSFVLLLGIMMVFISCAHTMQGYVSARTILNNYWESYLNLRDSMPDGERKVALRAKFNDTGEESYFTDAKKALDLWNDVVGTSGELNASKFYYEIFNKIMILLLSEGVIKIE